MTSPSRPEQPGDAVSALFSIPRWQYTDEDGITSDVVWLNDAVQAVDEAQAAAPEQESHPFVDSPYGPDRCRDCDHPESWHPARPEPDEAVRLMVPEAEADAKRAWTQRCCSDLETAHQHGIALGFDRYRRALGPIPSPPPVPAALDELKGELEQMEAVGWPGTSHEYRRGVRYAIDRLSHQSEDA